MRSIKFLDLDKKRDLLAKVEIFQDFNRFEIPRIAELCNNIMYYEEGESIIKQGTVGDCFYILLSGSAKVCTADDPISLFELEAGSIFGEISFLSGTERTKDVVANEKSFILEVSQAMMMLLKPDIREKIKDKLIEKLVARVIRIEGDSNRS
jgi:CRP/FNR family transcriptional regulator, cyclic AMP receptor protein